MKPWSPKNFDDARELLSDPELEDADRVALRERYRLQLRGRLLKKDISDEERTTRQKELQDIEIGAPSEGTLGEQRQARRDEQEKTRKETVSAPAPRGQAAGMVSPKDVDFENLPSRVFRSGGPEIPALDIEGAPSEPGKQMAEFQPNRPYPQMPHLWFDMPAKKGETAEDTQKRQAAAWEVAVQEAQRKGYPLLRAEGNMGLEAIGKLYSLGSGFANMGTLGAASELERRALGTNTAEQSAEVNPITSAVGSLAGAFNPAGGPAMIMKGTRAAMGKAAPELVAKLGASKGGRMALGAAEGALGGVGMHGAESAISSRQEFSPATAGLYAALGIPLGALGSAASDFIGRPAVQSLRQKIPEVSFLEEAGRREAASNAREALTAFKDTPTDTMSRLKAMVPLMLARRTPPDAQFGPLGGVKGTRGMQAREKLATVTPVQAPEVTAAQRELGVTAYDTPLDLASAELGSVMAKDAGMFKKLVRESLAAEKMASQPTEKVSAKPLIDKIDELLQQPFSSARGHLAALRNELVMKPEGRPSAPVPSGPMEFTEESLSKAVVPERAPKEVPKRLSAADLEKFVEELQTKIGSPNLNSSPYKDLQHEAMNLRDSFSLPGGKPGSYSAMMQEHNQIMSEMKDTIETFGLDPNGKVNPAASRQLQNVVSRMMGAFSQGQKPTRDRILNAFADQPKVMNLIAEMAGHIAKARVEGAQPRVMSNLPTPAGGDFGTRVYATSDFFRKMLDPVFMSLAKNRTGNLPYASENLRSAIADAFSEAVNQKAREQDFGSIEDIQSAASRAEDAASRAEEAARQLDNQ